MITYPQNTYRDRTFGQNISFKLSGLPKNLHFGRNSAEIIIKNQAKPLKKIIENSIIAPLLASARKSKTLSKYVPVYWDRLCTKQRLVTRGPLKNLREINPGKFYTGPFPGEKGIKELADEGIGVIINFRYDALKNIEKFTEIAQQHGMEYYNKPLNSMKGFTKNEMREVFSIINKAEKQGKKVYIHCTHGEDRTGGVRAIYRKEKMGWSLKKAVKEWENLGHRKKMFPAMKESFNYVA